MSGARKIAQEHGAHAVHVAGLYLIPDTTLFPEH